MITNGLNRDTVYYFGFKNNGWFTTERIYVSLNNTGYTFSLTEVETLLFSLASNGKVKQDFITLASGEQYNIWKKE